MRRITLALLLSCPLAWTQAPLPQGDTGPRPAQVSPQTAVTQAPKSETPTPAEVTQPAPAARVLGVENANGKDKDSARLRDRIYVRVQNLDQWLRPDDRLSSLILYLDDRPLPSVRGNPTGDAVESVRTIAFDLERAEDQPQELETWRHVLISARSADPDSVRLSVGLPDGRRVASDVPLYLKRAPLVYQALVIVGLFLAIGGVLWLAWTTDLLRNPGLAPEGGGKRRYSLARTQMAIWFCLVLVGWATLSLINMSAAPISDSLLVLMGISAATGLAATAVDAVKIGSPRAKESMQREIDGLVHELDGPAGLRARVLTAREALILRLSQSPMQETALGEAGGAVTKAALAPVPPNLAALELDLARKETRLRQSAAEIDSLPAGRRFKSDRWIKDILSDENGISIHRVQMFIWTIALGFYFVISVFNDLLMPEFGTQLLILMGISSGTYITLKVPEKLSPQG